jgi:hypothetical protein
MTRVVSKPTRTWSTPKRDEKVEFNKRNISSDSLKGNKKMTNLNILGGLGTSSASDMGTLLRNVQIKG